MDRPRPGPGFKMMKLMFKLRDIIRPRGKILKELGIKEGFQVLDFGCGPGGYIRPLSRMVGISGKVYALDINPEAVKAVKSLASRRRLANVTTILSGGPTGLKDGSIDVALLYDILHHLKNPDVIFKELHRVLKRDGVLSVSDHHMKPADIISKVKGTGLFHPGPKNRTINFFKAG